MSAISAPQFIDGRALVAELDIRPRGVVHRNLGVDALYQIALQSGQARLTADGALLQDTTPYFGRAAKSSFYVNDPETRFGGKTLDDLIAWGDPSKGEWDNLPIDRAT